MNRSVRPLMCLVLAAILAACGAAPAAQPANVASESAAAAPASAAASLDDAAASVAPTSGEAAASAAPSPHDAAAASYPVTIENCGRTLSFDRAPERPVTLYQTATEYMIALGLENRLVGATALDGDPPAELAAGFERLPELWERPVAREVLLSAQPDFVFAGYESYDLSAERGSATIDELGDAGAQVYIVDGNCDGGAIDVTLESVERDLTNLGRIFGVEDHAQAAIDELNARLAAVEQRVDGLPAPRVAFLDIGEGGSPVWAYANGIYKDLVERAGGTNIFDDQPEQFVEISAEEVASRNPDVFVVVDSPYGAPAAGKLELLYQTFPNAAASIERRGGMVVELDVLPGVRNAAAVEQLAQIFHPQASGAAAVDASFPLTVENCGVTTTYTKPPERVVSTALNVTELLLALELQDRIAGAISPGDRLLAPYRERFAGVNVIAEQAFPPPSREVIVAADPDLILSGYADDYGEAGFGTRQSFQDEGINTWLPRGACGDTPATIDDTYADIELLGRMFGVPDRAAALIAQMQAEQATAEPPATPVRVFHFDSGEDAPFTTGRIGLLTDLIARAGGENMFADVEQSYFTAGWEDVLARDPEVIVVTSSGATPDAAQIDAATQAKIDFLRTNPQLATITAIRNNRLVVLDITSQVPSVRNAAAIVTLARVFGEPGPSGARR